MDTKHHIAPPGAFHASGGYQPRADVVLSTKLPQGTGAVPGNGPADTGRTWLFLDFEERRLTRERDAWRELANTLIAMGRYEDSGIINVGVALSLAERMSKAGAAVVGLDNPGASK